MAGWRNQEREAHQAAKGGLLIRQLPIPVAWLTQVLVWEGVWRLRIRLAKNGLLPACNLQQGALHYS